MNVFAKFDEIPSMMLEVIKETKRYRHKNVSDTQSVGQRENSIPSHKHSLGGYKNHKRLVINEGITSMVIHKGF